MHLTSKISMYLDIVIVNMYIEHCFKIGYIPEVMLPANVRCYSSEDCLSAKVRWQWNNNSYGNKNNMVRGYNAGLQ